jgi:hypothetical protein
MTPVAIDDGGPVFALLMSGILAATPAPSPSPTPALAPCAVAKANLVAAVDSKYGQPGQAFRFTVTSVDDPGHAFPAVAPGATGWGEISVVRHGRTGGDPGLLVLETRYVIASDGTHVPVSLIRSISGLFIGKSHDSPPMLGFIPYVGYVTSAYDAFHKGGDVIVGPGDVLTVAIGDDAVSGSCRLPAPAP